MKNIFFFTVLFFSGIIATAQNNRFAIDTDSGRIVIRLFDNTPQHRDNIVKLIKSHFYDSTLFHRVIPEFVIQGGDPESKRATPSQMLGNGELGYRVPAEINDSNFHQRGALGMARDNNPEKSSSACQFYIVTGKTYTDEQLDQITARTGRVFSDHQRLVYRTEGGTPFLDGNYTVFGQVLEGMDVVEKIAGMPRNQADRPLTDVAMNKVYLIPKETKKKGWFSNWKIFKRR